MSLPCAMVLALLAANDMRPIDIAFDFEDNDPVVFWVSSVDYTVNFKGLTDEQVATGNRSFKLDVTFGGTGYVYFSIPVDVVAEGELELSGQMRVDPASSARAELGYDVVFPPTRYSGCSAFGGFNGTDDWQTVRGDVASAGQVNVERVLTRHAWGMTGKDAGVKMDRVGLFLRGGEGQRVVVYLDDVRLQGQTLTDAAFDAMVEQKAQDYQQRVADQHAAWSARLAAIRGAYAGGGEAVERFVQKVDELQQQLDAIAAKHAIDLDQHAAFASWLPVLEQAASALSELDLGKTLWFVVDPTGAVPIVPSDRLVPGVVSQSISIAAAPGEHEPASFVIAPAEDLNDVTLTATPPAGLDVDVRIVKCWYQAGSAWNNIGQNKTKRVLVPELLLYDDAMVRVDDETQRNELRVGDHYIDISDPDEPDGARMKQLDVAEYNVRDAATLQPVDIPANTNRQYWVTVRVAPDAAPGQYIVPLHVQANGQPLGTLTLNVRAYPFALHDPRTRYDLDRPFVSSVYYRSRLDRDHSDGTISSECRSETQLLAELRDMAAHNITNPTCYQPWGDQFARYLELRAEAGIDSPTLYWLGNLKPTGDEAALSRITSVLAWLNERGIETTYLYGIDEARGDRLKSQREAWIATREAGAKVFVAGYRGSNFPTLGDVQDLLVCAGPPSPEEAALWHSAGHEIWCYANPQTGPENPDMMRRNFGLKLWRGNYDGACTYAYMHSFGNIWNDFDNPTYRDHCFVYPTVDGVVDTLAIEGYREAIDDIRYATTLSLLIRDAMRDEKLRDRAVAARQFLDTVDLDGDLGAIRARIVDYILALHSGSNTDHETSSD